ncbi:hypothetical protein [Paenibacillus tuaregi]|uniref:hypothetical protein n=1 Tax=Paenibacillus tuaregi TaxID=1816681 RepID=UPI000838D5ED|nr:hypothetical protein [Paenibacillus tuaregi]
MQQFTVLTRELRKWLELFKWYHQLRKYDMHLVFGGLGIGFLYELLVWLLPYSSQSGLHFLFYSIPLFTLSHWAFLLGAWIMLTTDNIKYLPYGLWLKALLLFFPFTYISLSGLIPVAVYAVLGYFLFRYTASVHVGTRKTP